MESFIIAIVSGLCSSIFTIAAIKTDLNWVKETLKTHAKYHNHHFEEVNNLKIKVAKNA